MMIVDSLSRHFEAKRWGVYRIAELEGGAIGAG